jgi:hypothetical protein
MTSDSCRSGLRWTEDFADLLRTIDDPERIPAVPHANLPVLRDPRCADGVRTCHGRERCGASRYNLPTIRFGFAAPPVPGHLNPMIALAARLKLHGHEVVFFNFPDTEPRSATSQGAPNFIMTMPAMINNAARMRAVLAWPPSSMISARKAPTAPMPVQTI